MVVMGWLGMQWGPEKSQKTWGGGLNKAYLGWVQGKALHRLYRFAVTPRNQVKVARHFKHKHAHINDLGKATLQAAQTSLSSRSVQFRGGAAKPCQHVLATSPAAGVSKQTPNKRKRVSKTKGISSPQLKRLVQFGMSLPTSFGLARIHVAHLGEASLGRPCRRHTSAAPGTSCCPHRGLF